MGLPHPGKAGRGAAWWRRLLGEFTRTAETLSAFAAARGVARSSLHLWGRRLGIVTDRRGARQRPAARPIRPARPRLAPVTVLPVAGRAESAAWAYEVTLRTGQRLRVGPGVPPAQCAALVAALEGGAC